MELSVILEILILFLLAAVIVIQLTLRGKSEIGGVKELIKSYSEKQRDSVARQIADGTTEQFARFNIIQDSVQKTLQTNREENSSRLREFGE